MTTLLASEEVLAVAGGRWAACLNHYDTGGGCMVISQQVDECVYVVGQDDFLVGRYRLDEWLGDSDQTEVALIDCLDAEGAWLVLTSLRKGCLLWQCGACDGWIFTSDRPRIGVLRCSTCAAPGAISRRAGRLARGLDGS
jgi:hypothetical protein